MLLGLLQFIDMILNLIVFVILIQVVISWLLAFNILNMSNQFVATISRAIYQLTDPLLRPIRRFVPAMGGLDLSPLILILVIYFIQMVVLRPMIFNAARGLL